MLRPQKVRLEKNARQLVLLWANGRQVSLPWQTLRLACPCAGCREERDKAANPGDTLQDVFVLKPKVSDQLQGVEAVGNYALRLLWQDGHRTGIYSWELLSELAEK